MCICRYPKDDGGEAENGFSLCLEPAFLGSLVWGSRCPLIEKNLTDIDCNTGEGHRGEGSVVLCSERGGEEGEVKDVLVPAAFYIAEGGSFRIPDLQKAELR